MRSDQGMDKTSPLLTSDTDSENSTVGFALIDKVAQETRLPNSEIIEFMVNIIRAKKLDPQTLSLDELRSSIIDYIRTIEA